MYAYDCIIDTEERARAGARACAIEPSDAARDARVY